MWTENEKMAAAWAETTEQPPQNKRKTGEKWISNSLFTFILDMQK